MAFDGIVTKSIIAELNTCILGGKINKVFQPSKNDIILGIYSDGKNYALRICIDAHNCRINLTTNHKPNPQVAPNFCMFLRKHIIGFKISSITNYDLERVIIIELEGYDELNDLVKKKLIIELMGKHSNIILINSNETILDSIRHIENKDVLYRDILPAHKYSFPITNKISILNLDFYNFCSVLTDENIQSISKKISNLFIGISNSFIDNVISILNIREINKENLYLLFSYIQSIINLSNTDSISCLSIINNNNNKRDYTLIKQKKITNLDINFFIDDFYNEKENIESFVNYRNNVLKLVSNLLKKYYKKLENINLKLKECTNMEIYKKYGELITANLFRIDNTNLEYIELEDYYNNNSLLKIPLDNSISPTKNAEVFFKKYHKLKNTLSIASLQKIEVKKDLDYLESIVYELETATNINEIDDIYMEILDNIVYVKLLKKNKLNKKSKSFKSKKLVINPIEYEVEGYKVLVGKNNKQNDFITFKIAKKNDIWFHTKDIHGSHVVLLSNQNDNINENILINCAKIAAKHSKASDSSNIPVDYTLIKFVKKPSGSKPGKVIYTNQKTIYV